MKTRNRSLTAATASLAGLITLASVILVGPLHAQKSSPPAKRAPSMSGQGHMGMMGMMGPMQMTGTVTMNGKSYDMQCRMQPIGKPKSGSMMGGMMDKPMKMNGTMTMMGQKYRCEMVMMPTGNEGTQQGK